MKNKKIFIIILLLFIALFFVIIGKVFFYDKKENSKNNVELIEVKGFVSSKKQDNIIIILEENEINCNSLQIKNIGLEINDCVILKLKKNNNNIEVIECKKTYDESWILDKPEDTMEKIAQYNLDKQIYNNFIITDSKNRKKINPYIIPIKKEGKYIEMFSPDIFINYANTIYDSEQNFIFKEKNENVTVNMNMPKKAQLVSYNMINENNELSYVIENKNIKVEINESGTYYGIFKEDNDNYFELVFNIILIDN